MKKENRIVNRIKSSCSILLKKQKGVASVEYVLTTPVMVILLFASILFFLFCTSYFLISNSAFEIAQSLNMGDTGYKEHYKDSVLNYIVTDEYLSGTIDDNASWIAKKTNVKIAKIDYTSTRSKIFEKAASYYVKRRISLGGFKAPYATLDSISVKLYGKGTEERTEFSTNKGVTESGDMVYVKVTYNYLGFIKVTTCGYSFIV
jgi:Flp pilus assembly protein TadG